MFQVFEGPLTLKVRAASGLLWPRRIRRRSQSGARLALLERGHGKHHKRTGRCFATLRAPRQMPTFNPIEKAKSSGYGIGGHGGAIQHVPIY